jgi:hypothetical protein
MFSTGQKSSGCQGFHNQFLSKAGVVCGTQEGF